MSNVLITCNTYYQLLLAIQMKMTISSSDDISIIISDQSNNSRFIFERTQKVNIFDHVYYVNNKEYCMKTYSVKKIVTDIICAVFGKSGMYSCLPEKKVYDELIFYNPDIATHILFAKLYNINNKIKISRYEEGILSYNNKFKLHLKFCIFYFLRKIIGNKNLQATVSSFYCTCPELYCGKVQVKTIPMIDTQNDNFKKVVKIIFGIENKSLAYDEKYVYFSSIFDIEGGESIGELELILELANQVGKENLIVKVHPRDNVERFVKHGLKVDNNSSIPWEVIQLCGDFNNNVFLSSASGSVLSINSIIDKPVKTILFYNCIKHTHNKLFVETKENLEELISNDLTGKFSYITVAKSTYDFYNLI